MSLGQGQALTGPGELLVCGRSTGVVEQLGEDVGEDLTLRSRPSGIVEPGTHGLGLALGNILAGALRHRRVEAHGYLRNGHTFTLPAPPPDEKAHQPAVRGTLQIRGLEVVTGLRFL